MAEFADDDIKKLENVSETDIELLRKKFGDFIRKFSGRLDGMEMSAAGRKRG